MLTRRGFGTFAGCAICSLTGFSATEALAQGSAPTTANGVTRQILSRTDGPAAGYETIIMDVKIDKGTVIPRHTHPGIESTYVMEGALEVPVQGQETKVHKAGQAFQIPPETPHAGGKAPDENVHLMTNYIVEKGKPLSKPV